MVYAKTAPVATHRPSLPPNRPSPRFSGKSEFRPLVHLDGYLVVASPAHAPIPTTGIFLPGLAKCGEVYKKEMFFSCTPLLCWRLQDLTRLPFVFGLPDFGMSGVLFTMN